MESYEEITVKIENGVNIYSPNGNITSLAPAAVCSVASRILELRKFIKDNEKQLIETPEFLRILNHLARPISFEKEFLSSDIVQVHNGIKELGESLIK